MCGTEVGTTFCNISFVQWKPWIDRTWFSMKNNWLTLSCSFFSLWTSSFLSLSFDPIYIPFHLTTCSFCFQVPGYKKDFPPSETQIKIRSDFRICQQTLDQGRPGWTLMNHKLKLHILPYSFSSLPFRSWPLYHVAKESGDCKAGGRRIIFYS